MASEPGVMQGRDLEMSMEQLSIFQPKAAEQFKEIKLERFQSADQAKLQSTIEQLNRKLRSANAKLESQAAELQNLRSSNDNLVMINERLNKAYNKLTKK